MDILADAELDRLEHLSLVSRVINELENHFGATEKDIAEFMIGLAKTNPTFDKFKTSLEEYGLTDGFDDSLIQHILRLVLSMERKKKKQQGVAAASVTTKDEKAMIKEAFPVLSLPNTNEASLLDELEAIRPKYEKEKEEIKKKVLLHLIQIRKYMMATG